MLSRSHAPNGQPAGWAPGPVPGSVPDLVAGAAADLPNRQLSPEPLKRSESEADRLMLSLSAGYGREATPGGDGGVAVIPGVAAGSQSYSPGGTCSAISVLQGHGAVTGQQGGAVTAPFGPALTPSALGFGQPSLYRTKSSGLQRSAALPKSKPGALQRTNSSGGGGGGGGGGAGFGLPGGAGQPGRIVNSARAVSGAGGLRRTSSALPENRKGVPNAAWCDPASLLLSREGDLVVGGAPGRGGAVGVSGKGGSREGVEGVFVAGCAAITVFRRRLEVDAAAAGLPGVVGLVPALAAAASVER